MEQYIKKSALEAEIEKIKEGLQRNCNPNPLGSLQECLAAAEIEALNLIKGSLDSLEVKEVGLSKELNNFIEKQKAWIKDDWVVEYNNGNSFNHIYDLEVVAKHFFELGLSVNNPFTAADRGTAEEIIINLKRVEQDYRISLTKEIEWVRNQVKKGE